MHKCAISTGFDSSHKTAQQSSSAPSKIKFGRTTTGVLTATPAGDRRTGSAFATLTNVRMAALYAWL